MMWMTEGIVIGFGPNRVKVRWANGRVASVGNECLRVLTSPGPAKRAGDS
jgi:hypothetical protein